MIGRARPIAAVLIAAIAVLAPARARAQETVYRERKLALGVKLGIIPPIFTVAELVVRPVAPLAIGVFGIVTPDVNLGPGGTRTTVGGSLSYEFSGERRRAPYLSLAYAYYHAARDAEGRFETSHVVYTTAGYQWKTRHLDVYVGGGLTFLLMNETAPCTGFCVPDEPPPVLPYTELGLRFAFL